MCGFSHFINRRNRISRSFSNNTDWKLAGPSSQSPRQVFILDNTTTTASQSTHGGCRGTVVGAVVEDEPADEAECEEGEMRRRDRRELRGNGLSEGGEILTSAD